MKKAFVFIALIIFSCEIFAIEKDTLALNFSNQKKHNTTFSSLAFVASTSSFVGLNSLWYKDYQIGRASCRERVYSKV
jgi:hypothetical protein